MRRKANRLRKNGLDICRGDRGLAVELLNHSGLQRSICATLDKNERRKWDRLPISIPFFMRGNKENGEEFLEFATALNLSAGGALLASRRYLDPGTSIRLEIPVALVNKAQLPRSVSLLHARVLRCTPIGNIFWWAWSSKLRC